MEGFFGRGSPSFGSVSSTTAFSFDDLFVRTHLNVLAVASHFIAYCSHGGDGELDVGAAAFRTLTFSFKFESTSRPISRNASEVHPEALGERPKTDTSSSSLSLSPTFLTPTGFSPDDREDPAAVKLQKSRRCGKYTCCAEDTFGTRLWLRIKLDHIVADNSPFYILLKIAMVIVISLLLDKGTRNPDSVTTVFVGVLSLAPYLEQAKQRAIDTLTSGLLGAVIGTLVNAALYLPEEMDPNNWMIILSVPLSVLITTYMIYFFGRDNPTSMSAGLFSSLFVLFVEFPYPPIDPYVPDTPRRLIWQTLLVRVLALLTAIISAMIVNVVVSATSPLAIYRSNMFFTERIVWKTQKHRLDPVDDRFQFIISRVLDQIKTSGVVSKATSSWIFGEATRSEVEIIRRRSKAMFRFLAFRSFLELFREACDTTGDTTDLDAVNEIISMSIRNAIGEPFVSLEEELEHLERLPASMHVEKTVLKSILIDLRKYRVEWLPEDKINPFMGRV